jgi:hypothetical protein
MKRVFTDPRFPGIEVHNNGNNVFHVYERAGGDLQEIDTFTTYSEHPKYAIPDDVAQRRAKDYFERMAKGQMSQELSDGGEFADNRMPGGIDSDLPGNPDRDHTDIVNNPTPQPQSLDQMIGDGDVITSDYVLNAYERAKAIQDPAKREQALAQVRSMSAQMESSAQELVRRLLD